MTYKKIFLLIFLSFVLSQDYPEIGSSESLDVITWNIENFPKHSNTITYVTEIINDINVDIIALQEIADQNAFNELVENLNDTWVGYRAANSNYGELSYLINLDYINVLQTPYTILNQYEHYFAYRPPYVLKISFNDEEYILIDVHFKCCGDDHLDDGNYWDEEYRRLQASRYLKDYIDYYFEQDNVIILGDFNDVLTDPVSDNVFIDFINDENYYFADTHIAEGPVSDWSFPNWPSHIDHILITDELFDNVSNDLVFTFKVDEYMNSWQQYDNYISDHRPVVVNVYIPIYGDVNEDGNINILDITTLINFILAETYSEIADLNEDGGLNILDIVILINLILDY